MPAPDAARRFSNRVENYVRARPGYPEGVIDFIRQAAGITGTGTVADVGAGTGLTSEPFLRRGDTVYAVEPNDAMRAAAERQLAGYATFHSVAATAEATTLPAASVDVVVAGQAFHWFDQAAARREFARIARSPGWTALVWNTRRAVGTHFAAAYEALLAEFGIDYATVRHENIAPEVLAQFFDAGTYVAHTMLNVQQLDLAGFQARLSSSSYLPAAGDPRHADMLEAAAAVFAAHQQEGVVNVEYDCELHLGCVGAAVAT